MLFIKTDHTDLFCLRTNPFLVKTNKQKGNGVISQLWHYLLLIASPLYQHARKMKKAEVWNRWVFWCRTELSAQPWSHCFPWPCLSSTSSDWTWFTLISRFPLKEVETEAERVIWSDNQQASSIACCAHTRDPTSAPGLSTLVPPILQQGRAAAPHTLVLLAIGPAKPRSHTGPCPGPALRLQPPPALCLTPVSLCRVSSRLTKHCSAPAPYCSNTFDPWKHFWFV